MMVLCLDIEDRALTSDEKFANTDSDLAIYTSIYLNFGQLCVLNIIV